MEKKYVVNFEPGKTGLWQIVLHLTNKKLTRTKVTPWAIILHAFSQKTRGATCKDALSLIETHEGYNTAIGMVTPADFQSCSNLAKEYILDAIAELLRNDLLLELIEPQPIEISAIQALKVKEKLKTRLNSEIATLLQQHGTRIEIQWPVPAYVLDSLTDLHRIQDYLVLNRDRRPFFKITVNSEPNGKYDFLFKETYPFSGPICFVNDVIDGSFIPRSMINHGSYSIGLRELHPHPWVPTNLLSNLIYKNLTMKQLAHISKEELEQAQNIIINVGYCNTENRQDGNYPTRFFPEHNDADDDKDLHILIDPRDRPVLIHKDMAQRCIRSRVIHSKLLPLSGDEVGTDQALARGMDAENYKAHYNHTRYIDDLNWFKQLMQKHHKKIDIKDTMFFYGNHGLSCPRWLQTLLAEFRPRSYFGYQYSQISKKIERIEKCETAD